MSSNDNSSAPSVLVLGDNEAALASTKSLLLKFPCKFRLFTSADLALKELRASAVDIVISELRMTKNDGFEFMKEAAAIAPHTKRILIGGFADTSTLLLAVSNGLIDDYLHKPWKESEFIRLISKPAALKNPNPSSGSRGILYEFEEIPSPPRLQERLSRLLTDTRTPIIEIVQEIEINPALVARVLRAANSVHVGIHNRVTSIKEAVLYVGRDYIASIIIALEAFQAYSSRVPKRYAGLVEELSLAAVQRAMYTKEISANWDGIEDKYVAHVASLLQDIGIFARICQRPVTYDSFLKTMEELKVGPREAEFKVFGNVTHEKISAAILDHWNFPHEIVETVRMHHSENCSNDYVKIVQIATLIGGHTDGYPFDEKLRDDVPLWKERLDLLKQERL